MLCFLSGKKYNFDREIEEYTYIKNVIEYTNKNKQNVYLYTVPALQFRYLAYSVYEMPPKGTFSNLRVLGGWDMYTQNYYDFKERYNLDGNFKDLLKDNVYLIDGEVEWSGLFFNNYKGNVIYALKEHYDIDVKCELVEDFGTVKIYKLQEIEKD